MISHAQAEQDTRAGTLMFINTSLMREKQGLLHMGLNTLRRCRRLKNWKGLPMPQPHGQKGKFKWDQQVTETVVPLRSAQQPQNSSESHK